MSSVWFDYSDEEQSPYDSSSNTYYGIYNQDPLVIAKSLPRPKTPFNSHNSFEAPTHKGEEADFSSQFAMSSSPPSIPSFTFNEGLELKNVI